MKISDVVCEVHMWELPTPEYGAAFHHYPTGKTPLYILRITADDGTVGEFFRTDVSYGERDIQLIKHELIGRDPLDRERIWQRLWSLSRLRRDGFMKVLAAVDIALWDLAGKLFGVPIYKLIGGYRDRIKIYASSHSMPEIQQYLEDIVS